MHNATQYRQELAVAEAALGEVAAALTVAYASRPPAGDGAELRGLVERVELDLLAVRLLRSH